jgi:hypothetical protein
LYYRATNWIFPISRYFQLGENAREKSDLNPDANNTASSARNDRSHRTAENDG